MFSIVRNLPKRSDAMTEAGAGSVLRRKKMDLFVISGKLFSLEMTAYFWVDPGHLANQ